MNTCKDCGCQFEGYVSQQRCNPCREVHKTNQARLNAERRQRRKVIDMGGPWACQRCSEGEFWNPQKKHCQPCADTIRVEQARERWSKHGKAAREERKAAQVPPAVRQPRSHVPRRASTLADAGNSPSEAALHRDAALTGAAGATVQASTK